MSKINREWHETHRIPKNPTLQQRVDWHREHARHCECRPTPQSVRKLMEQLDHDSDR